MTCKKHNQSTLSFTATFGGSRPDVGYSVQQALDGGYIIAGWTSSYGAGGDDVWLVKTDASGNRVWDKTFGGAGYDRGHSVQQTSDGGYIIAGYTSSYGAGMDDVWLIKTDTLGDRVWDKTFGGTEDDLGVSVRKTTDGGYIIAGYTTSYGAGAADVWLVKTDASGSEVWARAFGGTESDMAYSVQQTSDGGYIVTGWTNSFGAGYDDVWLVKTDDSGNQVWNKTFGGSYDDEGHSVRQTSDGGYIIAGSAGHFGEIRADVWLIKTDSLGSKVWDKTYGGTESDVGYSVQQTSDGGYIVVGSTASFGGGEADVWLIKTDPSGNQVWNRTFGGPFVEVGFAVEHTADGGFVCTGITNSSNDSYDDVWLVKTDAEGN
jgi:hypothetical protein